MRTLFTCLYSSCSVPGNGKFDPQQQIRIRYYLQYSELSVNRPETVYVESEFLTSEVSTALRNDGLTIISNHRSGSEEGILPDLIIYQEISDELSNFLDSFGENQQKVMPADFAIESNNSFLSAGKLDNLQIVINDLRQGYIYPATIQE